MGAQRVVRGRGRRGGWLTRRSLRLQVVFTHPDTREQRVVYKLVQFDIVNSVQVVTRSSTIGVRATRSAHAHARAHACAQLNVVAELQLRNSVTENLHIDSVKFVPSQAFVVDDVNAHGAAGGGAAGSDSCGPVLEPEHVWIFDAKLTPAPATKPSVVQVCALARTRTHLVCARADPPAPASP